MTFQQNKFQVIKKAVPFELANFIFNYFLLKRDAVNYLYTNNLVAENGMLGTWKDQQVPNVYSHYADFVMETLLMKVMPIMKQQTNLNLIPTYSYARVYEKGSILKRHKDRPSCEISVTVMLGSDGTKWPIFMKGKEINLEPGDAAIYLGCEIEHWREEFKGDWHAQTFLHYVDKNGANKEWEKDKRLLYGILK